MTREELSGRATGAHQARAFPAKLVVRAHEVIEKVVVVLLPDHFARRRRRVLEEAERRDERGEGILILGEQPPDARLERVIRRAERRAELRDECVCSKY